MAPDVPHSARARAVLFLKSSIQNVATKYPSAGTKKLSGATSRMMIYWAWEVSLELFRADATDVNRPWAIVTRRVSLGGSLGSLKLSLASPPSSRRMGSMLSYKFDNVTLGRSGSRSRTMPW